MYLSFFKSIHTGIIYTNGANPPSSYRKGDSGLGLMELQQNLIKLKYELSKYEGNKFYGDKTVNAAKAFQKASVIIEDDIAGEKKNTKIAELINALNKPKERDLSKVTSLGDIYSFQVKATKDIGIYKYANLAEDFKALKEDAAFSV